MCTSPSQSSVTRDGINPETETLLADSIGPALLVILHTLAPAERLAFVLHDMFAVPFDDIAAVVGRSPAAARQLASRGRRRVQGVAPVPGTDLTRQRAIADAFLTAARNGDFDALLEALDPDVVVRSNGTEAVRGAAAVAGRAFPFTRIAQVTLPALINGAVGVVTAADGRPITLVGVHDHRREDRCDRPYRRPPPHRRSRPGHPRPLTGSQLDRPLLRRASHPWVRAHASERAAAQQRLTDNNARCAEDLHTICTHSASLLHTREFRCCDKGQGPQGASVACVSAAVSRCVPSEEQIRTNVTRHLE